MKILHVNNSIEGGGTETYIHRLIHCLEARGHDNQLFVQTFTSGNHPIQALKNTRENLIRLNHILHHYRPDVIHIHNINNFQILKTLLRCGNCLKSIHEFRPFCSVTRIRKDTRQICDDHLSIRCFKTTCFNMGVSSLYRFAVDKHAISVIRQFPRIWVMSHYMEKFIQPLLPDPSKLDVVPYFYDPPSDVSPSLPSAEPRIFTAGRLAPGKGFDLLIKMLSTINRPYQLKIAGDGPERLQLELLARSLNVPAEFLGHQPSESLGKWYDWSRFVVFPSTYPEPFGIVGLEAMGAARAVVAFDVGGIRDWLTDAETGFCVPPDHPSLFAQKVETLLTDHSLATRLGQNGRERLLDKFCSTRHILRLETVYQQLRKQS